jgi:hypothetical protein
MVKTKEEIKEKQKEWYLKNKKRILEERKKYQKEYNQTSNRKKAYTIHNWKKRGVIHEDINKLYEHYLNTTECDICKVEFNEKNWKCLDHDHDTGLFRNVLCNNCNSCDRWKKH